MKTASAGLDTHLQQEVTTLATCWKIQRQDGQTFTFTSFNDTLAIDIGDGAGEENYIATSSFNRTAIENTDDMSVDNLDLTGVLSATDIDETELRIGLFDFATIWIFFVNYEDLTQGILKMRKGKIGEVIITRNGFFQAELRGLTQAYSQNFLELYSIECRTDLGSDLCKVPIEPPIREGGEEVELTEPAAGRGPFAGNTYRRVQTDPIPNLNGVVMCVPADGDADDIIGPHTATLGSQASVQGTTVKFGTDAIEFSPSGSVNPANAFVRYNDDPTFTLGTDLFTIEGWIRFKDLTSSIQVFASQYLNTGSQRAWFFRRNAGDLQFVTYNNGASVAVNMTGAFTWAIDTWYHIAVTRDSSDDFRLFVAGNQVGATVNDIDTIFNSDTFIHLGKLRSTGSDDQPLDGFIDDYKMTVGDALYTSNFTPPASAHDTTPPVEVCHDAYEDRIYRVITAGTLSQFQPVYDTTPGMQTTDGTAVLEAEEAWSRAVVISDLGANPRKTFIVEELTPDSGGVTEGRDFFPDDSMNGGITLFETGDNAGVAKEIRDFSAPLAVMRVPSGNGAEDIGSVGGTPTIGANATVQQVVTKFGPDAIEFSPSGSTDATSVVSYPDDPGLEILSNEFTLEGWIRFKDLTISTQTFFSKTDTGGNNREFYCRRSSGNIDIFLTDDGTTSSPAILIAETFTPGWAIDTWYHVAYTRDASDDVRIFVDGIQYGSATNVSFSIADKPEEVRLGNLLVSGSTGQPLDGFLEDFNFLIGTAKYTENFTPPGKLPAGEQKIESFLDFPKDVQVGDKAIVYRGCHKRLLEDCVAIFENGVNHRGEAYLPGKGKVFIYPDAKAG